jgi:hypothetical protein
VRGFALFISGNGGITPMPSMRHGTSYVRTTSGARLNCIRHLLKSIQFKTIKAAPVKLPKRSNKGQYDDRAGLAAKRFVAEAY